MRKIFFGYYFLSYFALGTLLPLLPVYLNENLGMEQNMIGYILSFMPLVGIVGQPIWGYISDKTKAYKKILFFITAVATITGFLLGITKNITTTFVIVLIFSFFRCAIGPLSDRFALEYSKDGETSFGAIRLWGSIGYAVAGLVIGQIAKVTGLFIIFYIFVGVHLMVLFCLKFFPKENVTEGYILKQNALITDFKKLMKIKEFIFIIIISMILYGPLLSNNAYFSMYVVKQGGDLSIVGSLFFISAMSEVPFMFVANKWIKKIGMMKIILIASTANLIRWLIYFIEPNLFIIYIATSLQGIGFGLLLPAMMEYLRDIVPKNIFATAVTLQTSIGFGVGNFMLTLIAGYLLKFYSIKVVYGLFSGCTFVAILFIIYIFYKNRTSKKESVS